MASYTEKLLDPRWQKRRLEILEAAEWKCQRCECETKTLHVHHKIYRKGWQPWDYPNEDLQALCKDCHAGVSEIKRRIDEAFARMDEVELTRVLGYCEAMLLFSFGNEYLQSISINSIEYAEGVSDLLSADVMAGYEVVNHRDDRQLTHDDLMALYKAFRSSPKE